MKTTPVRFASIEAYIATFPLETQTKLQQLREIIHTAAPQAQEKIAYHMPTFELKGNLVLFAAWKKHIGFYGTSNAIREHLKDEVAQYENDKGSLLFSLDKPLPEALIKKIVQLRVAENLINEQDTLIRWKLK